MYDGGHCWWTIVIYSVISQSVTSVSPSHQLVRRCFSIRWWPLLVDHCNIFCHQSVSRISQSVCVSVYDGGHCWSTIVIYSVISQSVTPVSPSHRSVRRCFSVRWWPLLVDHCDIFCNQSVSHISQSVASVSPSVFQCTMVATVGGPF